MTPSGSLGIVGHHGVRQGVEDKRILQPVSGQVQKAASRQDRLQSSPQALYTGQEQVSLISFFGTRVEALDRPVFAGV